MRSYGSIDERHVPRRPKTNSLVRLGLDVAVTRPGDSSSSRTMMYVQANILLTASYTALSDELFKRASSFQESLEAELKTRAIARWRTPASSLIFLCPTKLHLCPQTAFFAHFFTLCPDPPILCPDPPILCPAFYVRKASGSSVDLGQLKRTGSDGRR